MKNVICLALLLSLLLCSTGCSLLSGDESDAVVFYYEQTEYRYGQPDGAIGSEERESTIHTTDPLYLMSLYMMGPISTNLQSPFPAGMRVLDVKVRMDLVRITVSEELNTLSESRRTLALTCLALTGMELCGQESVVIVCGEEHIILDRSLLTLVDNGVQIQNEKGETP